MTTQISPPKVDVIEQVIVCRSAASREELEKVNLSEAGVAMRSSLSEVASHDLHGPVKASNPCAFVRFSSSKYVWHIRKSLDLGQLEPHWASSGACNPAAASLRSGLTPMWQTLGPTTLQGSLTSRYRNVNSERKLINACANRLVSD